MEIQCKFSFEYNDQKSAKKIQKALEVDNYKFLKTEIKGSELISLINANSFMSLLHTAEDYLSCLTTAENILNISDK